MFTERQIELLESIKVPNVYWAKKSLVYKYYFRKLLHMIDSCLKWKNLPKNWSEDFFKLCLWAFGYVAAFQSPKYGDPDANNIAFQPASISGFDFYYRPTRAIVANPLYTKEFDIGRNCEMIRLTPNYDGGVFDIIDHYATMLAECDEGILMGLKAAKTPLILTAANQAQAETLKRVWDSVQEGKELVIYDNIKQFEEIIPQEEPFSSFIQDFKQSYVVDKLLENYQTILEQFMEEIGMPVPVVDKKAHSLNLEGQMQVEAAQNSRLECWISNLTESLEFVNEHFGTNISVEKEETENVYDAGRSGELAERGNDTKKPSR